jgi:hypothetical protein
MNKIVTKMVNHVSSLSGILVSLCLLKSLFATQINTMFFLCIEVYIKPLKQTSLECNLFSTNMVAKI